MKVKKSSKVSYVSGEREVSYVEVIKSRQEARLYKLYPV